MLFFDNMSLDFPIPVLVLDHSGKLLRTNQAANRLITVRPELHARLQCFLRAHVDNPFWNSAQDSSAPKQEQDLEQVWITPVAEGFVVLLPTDDVMAVTRRHLPIGSTRDIAYSSLINQEVLRELDVLGEQLSTFESQSGQELPVIAARIQYVRHLLSKIELLASTQDTANFALGEVVDLKDLLQEILLQQPGLHASIKSLPSAPDASISTGTLFARREWLRAALLALLLNQNDRNQAITAIELAIEYQEGFIALSCTLARDNQDISITNDGRGMPLTQQTTIDLALARHIIELHGGQLEMALNDEAELIAANFRVILPTGVPPHGYNHAACQQCVYPELVRVFARDLGRVLPRKPLRFHISPEEMQLLEQLHQGLSQNPET